jgi:hypothetical protein
MIILKKNIVGFLMLLVMLSCKNEETQTKINKYFDLKDFVNKKISNLDSRKPSVEKKITMGDSTDVLITKNIDWKSELELFVQADLNKPSYVSSYEIARPDSNTYIYSLKSTEKLVVKTLTIRLDSVLKQPVFVEAQLKDVNKLYDSEKTLTMICDNQGAIKEYKIIGYQHLAMTDAKKYSIVGQIK